MPSAAAERKIAPILVGFITFSSTATRRDAAHSSESAGSAGRSIQQSMPRVRWKPVSCVSTSSGAVYTGTSSAQRARISCPLPSMCFGSIRNDSGTQPASIARPMTSGLSATNIAFFGSARLRS